MRQTSYLWMLKNHHVRVENVYIPLPAQEAIDWIEQNCVGRWAVDIITYYDDTYSAPLADFYFTDEADAVMFKLSL
jgi:hypothetical protein